MLGLAVLGIVRCRSSRAGQTVAPGTERSAGTPVTVRVGEGAAEGTLLLEEQEHHGDGPQSALSPLIPVLTRLLPSALAV